MKKSVSSRGAGKKKSVAKKPSSQAARRTSAASSRGSVADVARAPERGPRRNMTQSRAAVAAQQEKDKSVADRRANAKAAKRNGSDMHHAAGRVADLGSIDQLGKVNAAEVASADDVTLKDVL